MISNDFLHWIEQHINRSLPPANFACLYHIFFMFLLTNQTNQRPQNKNKIGHAKRGNLRNANQGFGSFLERGICPVIRTLFYAIEISTCGLWCWLTYYLLLLFHFYLC